MRKPRTASLKPRATRARATVPGPSPTDPFDAVYAEHMPLYNLYSQAETALYRVLVDVCTDNRVLTLIGTALLERAQACKHMTAIKMPGEPNVILNKHVLFKGHPGKWRARSAGRRGARPRAQR